MTSINICHTTHRHYHHYRHCCFYICPPCPIWNAIAIMGRRRLRHARISVSSSWCAMPARNKRCLFWSAPTRLGRCSWTARHRFYCWVCWTNSQRTPARTPDTKARSMWSSWSAGSCCWSSHSADMGNYRSRPKSTYFYLEHPRWPAHRLPPEAVRLREQQVVLVEILELGQPLLPLVELIRMLHIDVCFHYFVVVHVFYYLQLWVVQAVVLLRLLRYTRFRAHVRSITKILKLLYFIIYLL